MTAYTTNTGQITALYARLSQEDALDGDNDFTPFRNLFNDFYAKDTSKKVRAIKWEQG